MVITEGIKINTVHMKFRLVRLYMNNRSKNLIISLCLTFWDYNTNTNLINLNSELLQLSTATILSIN